MLTDAAIRHTVSFRLHPDADEAAFVARLLALEDIDGVEEFELLDEVSPKNDFTHGLSMTFADRATYDGYNAHADHQAFVSEVWLRDVADFLELDYRRQEAAST